jgi:hypothetical protein
LSSFHDTPTLQINLTTRSDQIPLFRDKDRDGRDAFTGCDCTSKLFHRRSTIATTTKRDRRPINLIVGLAVSQTGMLVVIAHQPCLNKVCAAATTKSVIGVASHSPMI